MDSEKNTFIWISTRCTFNHMILELAHTKLDVFIFAQKIVIEVYHATNTFPDHERFGLTSQIRRASVSVVLNTAEGSSRRSFLERKRYFEIARGSLIELDTALDISSKLGFLSKEKINTLTDPILRVFKILCKLISS